MLFLLCRSNKVTTFAYKTNSNLYTIKDIDYYVEYDDEEFEFKVMIKVVDNRTNVKSHAAVIAINSQGKFHHLVT